MACGTLSPGLRRLRVDVLSLPTADVRRSDESEKLEEGRGAEGRKVDP